VKESEMTATTATATANGFWAIRDFDGRGSRTAHFHTEGGNALCGTNVLRAARVIPAHETSQKCAKCLTLSTARSNNKEIKMTTKTATKSAPASDPKPTAKRPTKKAQAAETVVPEPTDAQKKRMLATALSGATKATKAADAVTVTDDARTVERANHLREKAVAARVHANEIATKFGLDLPFTTEDTTFTPISMQDNETEDAPAESATPAAKFGVVLRNMTDGSVEGHAAGCADLKRKAKRGAAQPSDEPWALTVSSKHEAWAEYNADFIAECEQGAEGAEHDHEKDEDCDHSWGINWLPCADAVPARDGDAADPEPFKAAAPKAKAAAGTRKATTAKAAKTAPATPKEKAPAKVAPTAAEKSQAKAQGLADAGTAAGWTPVLESYGTNGFTVTLTKGDEEMGAKFIDGKLGLEPEERPYYKNAARPRPVLLRNVSAMRQQMAEDETARPIARETTRVARSERSDRPRVTFSWDDALDDAALLDALQTNLTGKRITWNVTLEGGTEEMEVLVGSVKKVGRTPSNDRTVDFFEMEITKAGVKPSRQRTLTLKSIRRAI
jgi:hypothetical protein